MPGVIQMAKIDIGGGSPVDIFKFDNEQCSGGTDQRRRHQHARPQRVHLRHQGVQGQVVLDQASGAGARQDQGAVHN